MTVNVWCVPFKCQLVLCRACTSFESGPTKQHYEALCVCVCVCGGGGYICWSCRYEPTDFLRVSMGLPLSLLPSGIQRPPSFFLRSLHRFLAVRNPAASFMFSWASPSLSSRQKSNNLLHTSLGVSLGHLPLSLAVRNPTIFFILPWASSSLCCCQSPRAHLYVAGLCYGLCL